MNFLIGLFQKKSTLPRRMGSFFIPRSHLDFLKPNTPLPPGFPRRKGVKVNQLFNFFTSIITRT